MRKIVVMVADRNPFTRAGMCRILSEQDRVAVHEVMECDPGGGGHDAMDRIRDHSPDVVLLDIDYPRLSGLELSKKIARHFPSTKVVLVSGNPQESDAELFDAVKTGAAAYLQSNASSTDELIDITQQAANGEYPINNTVSARPNVAWRVLKHFQQMASIGKTIEEAAAPITPREVQVLTAIADGCSNKQIARSLGISDQTIKNHVSAILRKINANDRTHAVVVAIREGLISLDPSRRDDDTGGSFARGEALVDEVCLERM